MVKKVSSPNKIRSNARLEKASNRMGKADVKSRQKITKKPVKVEKGTTLDDCNLDELIIL
jgi:hypothetical protein